MLIERNGVLVIENTAHAIMNGIGLEVGKNIESLALEHAFNTQFHTIDLQGAWDEAHARVTNTSINPERKKVLICDQIQTADACQSRAEYEQSLALAKSLTASASISGLYPELTVNGLNRVISVTDTRQNFNEMMMIKALGLSVSENSMSTKIDLCRPFQEQNHVGI